MMVSLGAIDKMGHMWGPEDNVTGPPGSDQEISHLPFAAKNADRQVGRIVRALKRRGLRDDTLIVITADHAAQTGTPGSTFFGRLDTPVGPTCGGIRSDCNWYFGTETGAGEAESYEEPSPAVQQLDTTLGGNVAFSYQDGHVAVWLTDTSLVKKHQAADAVLDMPGVIASYHLNAAQDDYVLFGTNPMDAAEQSWFQQHGDELVDTMAAPNGSDVVGLVKTDVTYGVVGDHGGHSRLIQQIPMVFDGPGVNPKDSNLELRLVDVVPTILETMGIEYDPGDFDGEAVDLSKAKP
jgi:arylsulfatase A-like enzyme